MAKSDLIKILAVPGWCKTRNLPIVKKTFEHLSFDNFQDVHTRSVHLLGISHCTLQIFSCTPKISSKSAVLSILAIVGLISLHAKADQEHTEWAGRKMSADPNKIWFIAGSRLKNIS